MGSGASNLFSQNPMKKGFPPEDVPTFKIVLVGDPNVGKSSIFLRYTREQFDYSYQPTMNVNIGNVTKKVQFPFETLVSISLWDLPGREEIDLRRSYYKDIDAAIVVVDLSDEGSLEMAGTWKQDINNNSTVTVTDGLTTEKTRRKSVTSQAQVPILLIGNKLDKVANITESNMNDDLDDGFDDDKENNKKVTALEEIALQHSFVGSVAVSACECDGGVHAAFRSLMRFLLQKKMPKKTKKEYSENKTNRLSDILSDPSQHGSFTRTLASVDDHIYEPLKITRVPEVDEILETCDRQVKSMEICSVGLLIAVKNFKKACCVSGITDTYKSSIEECITSLKDTLRNGRDEDILIGAEESGYIKLSTTEKSGEIPGQIKRVLDIYDKEVCKRTRRVLSQCPSLKVNLTDQLSVLENESATLQEAGVGAGLNKKQIRVAIQNLNDNLERIKDTIYLADESMKITDDQFKKIKNAMMW